MEKRKGELVYEGKAKRMYAVVDEPELIWVEYKDSLTAFNAQKKSSFAGKGAINAQITVLLYQALAESGIPTHFVESINPTELICQKVQIIPLEVVTRNRLAGSTAKKFGRTEGEVMNSPLVEFYYKDDALNDPFVSDDQALFIGAVKGKDELGKLRVMALEVNQTLSKIMRDAGIDLIDFKLEFGRNSKGQMLLADEISPDTCRLWDSGNGNKLDKDRFRRDLGGVEDAYQEVLRRLKGVLT